MQILPNVLPAPCSRVLTRKLPAAEQCPPLPMPASLNCGTKPWQECNDSHSWSRFHGAPSAAPPDISRAACDIHANRNADNHS
eukprot:1965484-Amphidinium_carterae.1